MRLNTKEPALLSTREAGRLLGIIHRTVALKCQSGDLRAVRIGERGGWRVVRASVDALVRAEPVTSKYGVREVLTTTRDEGGEAA